MWKQVKTQWLISSFSVFVLCLVLNLPITAQETGATVLVASQSEDGIQLYRVDAAGQHKLIATLTDYRVGEPNGQDLWFIDHPHDLTVSPDGTRIAFTAQWGDEWRLFVYTLATDELDMTTLPAALIPVWSPDSSAILLTARSSEPPYNDYIYDIGEQHLTQITNTPQYGERHFRWLPDSSGLFYAGLDVVCETCPHLGGELHYITRDGDNAQVLTNLAEIALYDPFPSVCVPTWSVPNQRVYYSVGCARGGDDPDEYLYSIDLGGNNRAELSVGLSALYPEEFNVSTVNIHPSPITNDLYLTMSSQGGDGTSRSNWRILHLQAPDVITTVYEQTIQDESLDISSMSPDASAIALITYGRGASNGFLEVIDLETGQRIVERDVAPLDVCYTQWADENTLFYVVDPTGICALTYEPQTVWVLDITTSATHEVTDGLGDNVWMLRQ